MGRTFTENRLADNAKITFHRFRNASGALEYRLIFVVATVDNASGEVVREREYSDADLQLPRAILDKIQGVGNALMDKIAERLDVTVT